MNNYPNQVQMAWFGQILAQNRSRRLWEASGTPLGPPNLRQNLKIKDLKKNNGVRKKLAKIYDKKCDSLGIRRIHVMPQAESAYYVYPIIVKKRDLLMKELKKENIYSQIHYEIPIHLQTAYKKTKRKDLKITENISKNIF